MQRYYTDFMLFQFHKGTIRTLIVMILIKSLSDFNSIKVQLEPKIPTLLFEVGKRFQFHKGTIRTLVCLLEKP